MQLKIVGHDRLYDLQSIASAFFPGMGFDGGEPEIESEICSPDGAPGCRTLIRGESGVGAAFVPLSGETSGQVRAAVKGSFFAAAVDYTGFVPEWGTFTGIRPVKEFAAFAADGTRAAVESFVREFGVSEAKAELCAAVYDERKGLYLPTARDDLSLYISIPFCPTRCAYCSFISGAGEKMLALIPEYVEALKREIAVIGALAARRRLRLRTVYVGGGTPAVLSPEQLASLCRSLRESFDCSALCEFTVELGRPDAVTAEKLAAVREGGAGRVCVNAQTLSDEVLAQIGRRHTAAQFCEAMREAVSMGFDAVNCDLIAGLPGDTPEGFAHSLDTVLSLGANNITVHALCIKQGSTFKCEGNTTAVREKSAAEMVEHSIRTLRSCGMKPYYIYKQKNAVAALENTGWEKGATAGIYNILMMDDLGTVLGAGAGSSSKIIGGVRPRRICSHKYPYEYLRDAGDFTKKAAAIETALEKAAEG